MSFEDRFPNFVPLSATELGERIKTPVAMYPNEEPSLQVDLTVDRISHERDAAERLAKLEAVYRGATGKGWCTGKYSEGMGPAMPMVGHAMMPPICRMDWVGAPDKAAANMRFIAAAHSNFAFLLELAAEGLAARQAQAEA